MFPMFKVDTGRLRSDGDPPYIAVSVIAHPLWYVAAVVIVATFAVLS